ncbi:MAG: hypothetical protein ABI042_08125 [Verrucomicrobiota bacterium]
MTAIFKIPTRRFILIVALMAVAAGICEILDRVTWQNSRPVSHLFDVAGLVLFWLSYTLCAILLIVGPLRPRTVFSLHGECGVRAMNFFLALGVFASLNLWIALASFYLFA